MMAVVGTGVGRVVNEQMQLGPHTIPKGTILWAPIQAIQSSPALWDKPDSFMPVRGLPCGAAWSRHIPVSRQVRSSSQVHVKGRCACTLQTYCLQTCKGTSVSICLAAGWMCVSEQGHSQSY